MIDWHKIDFLSVGAIGSKVMNFSPVRLPTVSPTSILYTRFIASCGKHNTVVIRTHPGCLALHLPELPISIFDYQIVACVIPIRLEYVVSCLKKSVCNHCFSTFSKPFFVRLWPE